MSGRVGGWWVRSSKEAEGEEEEEEVELKVCRWVCRMVGTATLWRAAVHLRGRPMRAETGRMLCSG